MLSIWTVGTVVGLYLLLLFGLAFWGEKRLKDNRQHPILYSLGLGVHCTSWAFFGTTSQASEYGWAIVPTYMGIMLTMAFAFPVVLHISRLCQQHNISSLADLIGLKYQHSHLIAALITLLCFVGVIPYIALQLDAITKSIALITSDTESSGQNVSLYMAALMALFAIIFGTRSLNLTEKHPGLLLSIAVESLVKLLALWVVGIFVCFYMFDGFFDLVVQSSLSPAARDVMQADSAPWVYVSHIMLGVCSMFVLPRQFHMNFVELNGEGELRTARWLFPLYLLGMTVFLIPLALAGKTLLPATVNSDAYVLALPLFAQNPSISIIAFIGGLSATTSMVIVATLSLGIMMSNNLITPLWLKLRLRAEPTRNIKASKELAIGKVLAIRRLTVLVVLSVALWYHLNVSQAAPLVTSGIIAIALLAQSFPVLMFGLYWSRSNKKAAVAGLFAGFSSWLYFLLYPSIMSSYYFNSPPSDNQLALGFGYSLLANVGAFLLVSWLSRQNDHPLHAPTTFEQPPPALAIKIGDLTALTARVLDAKSHHALMNKLSLPRNKHLHPALNPPSDNQYIAESVGEGYASHALLTQVETLLSAQVGAPSARILLGAIAHSHREHVPELVDWVEEASQSFQFNHEVLQSSVQHIEQGISVLDEKLKLLAWNDKYIEMFNYPEGVLKAGMSIEQILSYNAERGLFGDNENAKNEITKRVAFMRQGSRYKYVRKQQDGKVIELNGSPLPGGGYVTTYSDITEYIAIQHALENAKSELEVRVARRTEQLQQAKIEADKANESKTKFLAAAGHDLMQPFNAATLFAAMLKQKTQDTELASLSEGVVNSLHSAENLLSSLLDMTKLESGVLETQPTPFKLDEVIGPLVQEFRVIAQQKNLRLDYVRTQVWVYSDKNLLRRVAQNLLSNAIRYTEQGRVLVGVRRKSTSATTLRAKGQNENTAAQVKQAIISQNQCVQLCIVDTGLGIAEHQQQEIFAEFHQLDSRHSTQGLGLGLTIVERICKMLEHALYVSSELERGSAFSVELPRVIPNVCNEQSSAQAYSTAPWQRPAKVGTVSEQTQFLQGQRILLLENDEQVTAAMTALLAGWGATVVAARTEQEAREKLPTPPDTMLIDYHLDNNETGTRVVAALTRFWQQPVPGILITANRAEDIREKADALNLQYLPKPVKPPALKRILKRHVR